MVSEIGMTAATEAGGGGSGPGADHQEKVFVHFQQSQKAKRQYTIDRNGRILRFGIGQRRRERPDAGP